MENEKYKKVADLQSENMSLKRKVISRTLHIKGIKELIF